MPNRYEGAPMPVADLTRTADEETSDVRAGAPRKRRSLLRR